MNLRTIFFNNFFDFNYLFNNLGYNSLNPNILVSDFDRLLISRNQLVILLNDQSHLSLFLSDLFYIFVEILFKLSDISCLFYFKIFSLFYCLRLPNNCTKRISSKFLLCLMLLVKFSVKLFYFSFKTHYLVFLLTPQFL
jgi:hypothetical protein